MKKQYGFSLIEVLVTLVLVTTGILGMISMQGRSIQYTHDSAQRNAAVDLSNQLVEIMRANPQLLFSNFPPAQPASSDLLKESIFYKKRGSNYSPAPVALADGDCTAPNTAIKQRDCWLEQAKSKLPNATALLNEHFYVCRSPSPTNTSTPNCSDDKGSIIEIQLAWNVKNGGCPDLRAPNETTCIYRTRIEL
ncbi:MAG: type IV pilus modification protein PilV [Gammaproteobacteria bacterium HGW-Gammaproteobacteria-13]|nr:MAG: type IV pilus modification protein PilV [Gammaproteobacteria bacterium HGW-Gammaproteobacteria-13]